MDLKELKERLKKFNLQNIKPTKHAFKRIQDKRRQISHFQIATLLVSQEDLYKFQEQPAKNLDEIKIKLWFQLNYVYDMNVYIVMKKNLEKDLNTLKVISAHKVKRKIQKEIEKNEN